MRWVLGAQHDIFDVEVLKMRQGQYLAVTMEAAETRRTSTRRHPRDAPGGWL